ncbi:tRNA (adenosine(37)-N6)-threonylcarbamoyltransferase complex dimerization subunit type 1 TsaB [Candidatus Pantoea edessiphila]|uniref:tRNA threonylcarbamoyladenosine biosynthesis protein TsaB n=1 Tax=Candidatus Pantoea edessiphila TaxID=2044610 RepID=A0A2P5T2L4_9GAMM|nr:tRNA (adenosine(37)-N6)-threonylcarbamoyltransferase complex dimerization subunit type 1 TsaB [Candidatus Pantoea edessiphila]PPI88844.1 tRNA (adenosine(37)-N6)-threonylcarbamoyltransferase complex dimerization subunit type 1 TsaB [Candidatus Pantoea edessiphila]
MSIRILAFNTATEACSVALLDKDKIYTKYKIIKQNSSNHILSLINELLQSNNIELIDINAIAFSIGPGSFTGIRIGIGVAQGLAFFRPIIMLGISTLETLAQGAWRTQGAMSVLTAIDARMGEIYWAKYSLDESNQWLMSEKEIVLPPKDILERIRVLDQKWSIAGNGWEVYPELYQENKLYLNPCVVKLPLAEDMLPLAKIAIKKGNFVKIENINPVYLRDKVIK